MSRVEFSPKMRERHGLDVKGLNMRFCRLLLERRVPKSGVFPGARINEDP